MHERIKNMAVLLGIVAAAALVYAAASFAHSYSRSVNPASFRSFSVSAQGKAVAVPDIAQFSLSVITEGGKDIGVLQTKNSEKMNKINAFLKSNGIGEKDMKTTQYAINPRYQYYNCSEKGGVCPPPDIVGYTINQSVQVKIHDFTKIGVVLSGGVANGANSVSQLVFTIDDPAKPENEARAEAVRKAHEKAEGLARAGGFTLGKLLSIEESGAGFPTPYFALEGKYGRGGATAESPVIEPGSQEVSVTVILKYEMK